MDQPEAMSELMYDFLDRSIDQESFVGGQTIELGVQTHHRHDGGRTSQLGLPEHEGEYGNEQILRRDSDDPAARGGQMAKQLREQERGVILLPFGGIEGREINTEGLGTNEMVCRRGHPTAQFFRPRRPEAPQVRQQDLRLHPDRIPYFLILL